VGYEKDLQEKLK